MLNVKVPPTYIYIYNLAQSQTMVVQLRLKLVLINSAMISRQSSRLSLPT